MSDMKEIIKRGVEVKKSSEEIRAFAGADRAEFYRAVSELIGSGEIPNILLCYCGYDCARCRTFRATLSGDDAEREKIAEYYKTVVKRDIPPEKLRCFSGRSDEVMKVCLECPFMRCAKEKNLQVCADCPQYPCPTLKRYMEKYIDKANQV